MMDMTQGDFILAPQEVHVQCPYNFAHIVTNAKLIVHLNKCQREYAKECERSGKQKEIRICHFNDTHRVYAPEIKFHEERCKDRFNIVSTIRYHTSEEFTKSQQEDDRRRKERDLDRSEKDKSKHSKHKHHDKRKHRDHKDYRDQSPKNSTVVKDYEHGVKQENDLPGPHKKKHKHSMDETSTKSEPQDNVWGENAEDWESETKGYEPAYNPDDRLKNGLILYQPGGLSKSERKQFRVDQRLKASRWDSSGDRDSKDINQVKVDSTLVKVKDEPKDSIEIKVKHEPHTFKTQKVPPPKIEPKLENLEKEDGECSGEEHEAFVGEDPFG